MEKILIIDTETTNDLTDSLVYDCGFIVADYNGTIYSKHSFVNADVFCNKELMASEETLKMVFLLMNMLLQLVV